MPVGQCVLQEATERAGCAQSAVVVRLQNAVRPLRCPLAASLRRAHLRQDARLPRPRQGHADRTVGQGAARQDQRAGRQPAEVHQGYRPLQVQVRNFGKFKNGNNENHCCNNTEILFLVIR